MTIQPIFVFSAPRSGSTLVQRVLGAHAGVATASEPWVLLPALLPLREEVPAASRRDELVRDAVADFVAVLPHGRADYLAAIREAALRLYAAAAGTDSGFFVDKTPLYHLVVDEIVEAFPDGRFVFLWRNPLSVIASAVQLFDHGRWEVNRYTMALFQSIDDLVPASQRHAAVSHCVRYEDLVAGGEGPWQGLANYLGVPFEPEALARFPEVILQGRMGDPTGVRDYDALASEPLTKWRASIDSSVRRAWARRYLRWIGRERLAVMGYDLDALLSDVGPPGPLGRQDLEDAVPLATSMLRDCVKRVIPRHAGDRSAWPALLGRGRPR